MIIQHWKDVDPVVVGILLFEEPFAFTCQAQMSTIKAGKASGLAGSQDEL